MMSNGLHNGDKTQDDSLVLLEEEWPCYSVKSIFNAVMAVWLTEPRCSFFFISESEALG